MKSNTERISSTANIDLTLDTSAGALEAVVVVESEVEAVVVVESEVEVVVVVESEVEVDVVVVVLEESGVQSSLLHPTLKGKNLE